MLVFLKNDMGYSTIGGQRVYGKKFAYGSFGPTEISVETFNKYRDVLVEAEFTKKWLSDRYGVEFPDISFRLSNLGKMDTDSLLEIADCIGIKFIKDRRKKFTAHEKRALCRCIRKALA